jgi:hypothetical protein
MVLILLSWEKTIRSKLHPDRSVGVTGEKLSIYKCLLLNKSVEVNTHAS